ncbi:bifunctional diguanylate cyclase/phosphodiesterase [Photobacterium sp. 1_MG-2023]|uniref:putative bifunctional diguanylate cyclase/phosphodiesterase n=1 Tax=Photobacterium sp. 1_MG-2023 TaxID=3062646 RepID=UPI0026E2D80E|nr:EAL domain-containing protein [Photobacterium sp. 1_MG-2023]MDO6708769.1 EAL domain-containing protein [Photobacterium sp. 1_MG-2023]
MSQSAQDRAGRQVGVLSLILSLFVKRTLIKLAVFAIIWLILASQFEWFEHFTHWVSQYHAFGLGAFISLLLVLPIALVGLSWRRIRQMTDEIKVGERDKAAMYQLAMHDPLTELPNRLYFSEQLQKALQHAGDNDACVAVLMMDLNKFKQINDAYGHIVGDELLVATAGRLKHLLRMHDTIARLGGDEFALIHIGGQEPDEASALASRIIKAMSEPYHIRGQQILAGVSIGIAMSNHDIEPVDLLRAADTAMYRAKMDGGSTFAFFDTRMDEQLKQRQLLERDLRKAIAQDLLEPYYQPVFDLKTRQIEGFEALLRWRHQREGMVSSQEFIPVAEDAGLIQVLGDWVMKQACIAAMDWPEEMRVSVNISVQQLKHETFRQSVANALSESGLNPARLEIEFTAQTVQQDPHLMRAIMQDLKHLGVSLVLDDFGNGNACLTIMRDFPFDKVKVARACIGTLPGSEANKAMIQSVVGMSASLGMQVAVVGIEDESQLALVSSLGCRHGQGFLLGHPLSRHAAGRLLLNQPDQAMGS